MRSAASCQLRHRLGGARKSSRTHAHSASKPHLVRKILRASAARAVTQRRSASSSASSTGWSAADAWRAERQRHGQQQMAAGTQIGSIAELQIGARGIHVQHELIEAARDQRGHRPRDAVVDHRDGVFQQATQVFLFVETRVREFAQRGRCAPQAARELPVRNEARTGRSLPTRREASTAVSRRSRAPASRRNRQFFSTGITRHSRSAARRRAQQLLCAARFGDAVLHGAPSARHEL